MTGAVGEAEDLAQEVADGAIRQIRAIVNPDKLRHVGEVVNVPTCCRGGRRDA